MLSEQQNIAVNSYIQLCDKENKEKSVTVMFN